jgi:hypothetical protein
MSPLLIVGMNVQTFGIIKSNCIGLVDVYGEQFRPLNDHVEAVRTSLKWINVQAILLDICIVFYPLDLPPYVLLEIVDRFAFWSTHVNHKKKIDYIIQIKQFCDQLIDARKNQQLKK